MFILSICYQKDKSGIYTWWLFSVILSHICFIWYNHGQNCFMYLYTQKSCHDTYYYYIITITVTITIILRQGLANVDQAGLEPWSLSLHAGIKTCTTMPVFLYHYFWAPFKLIQIFHSFFTVHSISTYTLPAILVLGTPASCGVTLSCFSRDEFVKCDPGWLERNSNPVLWSHLCLAKVGLGSYLRAIWWDSW